MRPVPPGGQFDYVTAPDGARLRYGTWPGAAGRPTILLLPGLRESIEKHFETVEDLQARGFHIECNILNLHDRVGFGLLRVGG